MAIAGVLLLLLVLGIASANGCGTVSVLIIHDAGKLPIQVELLNNGTTVWRDEFDGWAARNVYLKDVADGSLVLKATLSDGTILEDSDYVAHLLNTSVIFAIGKAEIVESRLDNWMAFGVEPGGIPATVIDLVYFFVDGASCLAYRPLDTLLR